MFTVRVKFQKGAIRHLLLVSGSENVSDVFVFPVLADGYSSRLVCIQYGIKLIRLVFQVCVTTQHTTVCRTAAHESPNK